MPDEFTPYETGLDELKELLGSKHLRYNEYLRLESRLLKNIAKARSDDTEKLRADRDQATVLLNRLALSTAKHGFNEKGLVEPPKLIVTLLLNCAVAVALAFLLGPPAPFPCAHPLASALGRAVILLLLGFHLLWRFLSSFLIAITLHGTLGPLSIITRDFSRLLDQLHPWILSNVALGVWLIVLPLAAWVLGLSPLSPFRPEEAMPNIQSFSVRYLDGTTKLLMPGDAVEIIANEQVLVEAEALQQTDLPCTWSVARGTKQPAEGCSILYSAPFEGAHDTLVVLIQSPCQKQQAYAGLHINIVQALSSP